APHIAGSTCSHVVGNSSARAPDKAGGSRGCVRCCSDASPWCQTHGPVHQGSMLRLRVSTEALR
ncbi:unnamed protein product, partial [Polarella glacialis]